MDKSQQCSRWDYRPLTPSQITYAAIDAAVLPLLLDEMLNGVSSAVQGQGLDLFVKQPRLRVCYKYSILHHHQTPPPYVIKHFHQLASSPHAERLLRMPVTDGKTDLLYCNVPFNSYQYNLLIYSVNTPYQHNLSIHTFLNTILSSFLTCTIGLLIPYSLIHFLSILFLSPLIFSSPLFSLLHPCSHFFLLVLIPSSSLFSWF